MQRWSTRMTSYPRNAITGVVLAGGRARRMGGHDKGLLELVGEPLAVRAVRLLAPQVGTTLVNANRNQARYADLLVGQTRVVSDSIAGFCGPLAGMLVALEQAATELVLTVPCDCPLLRTDYAARMTAALSAANAEVAVAHDGERLQPVFALLRRELTPALRQALNDGERKIDRWYAQRQTVSVDFADGKAMFRNVNTPQELAAMQAELAPDQPPAA